MRVPVALSEAFCAPFEERIASFCVEQGLLPDAGSIQSTRFLSRSVIPHVRKLSALFNRLEPEGGGAVAVAENDEGAAKQGSRDGKRRAFREGGQGAGLDPYWKESSNPANLRLASFLYFMPSNLYRVAAIWSELGRLGYRWRAQGPLRAIEFGAGPASGACGVAAGERFARLGLPASGDWALIEQDKAMLALGSEWAQSFFASQEVGDWGTRAFHRQIDFARGLLPRSAPSFNLWVMSYFLNESTLPPRELAELLVKTWERHLDEEGLVVLVEPALKLQSRKLLELRRELLAARERLGASWMQILLPCLGHQACGALSAPQDWCHEEVSWWRPPYFRVIDRLAELDRKTLPFSYLVVTKSSRPREEILPALADAAPIERLVSPAHMEGKEQEFFVCGQNGKRRARYRALAEAKAEGRPEAALERGDVLAGAEIRGDVAAGRVERIRGVK
jgi:hypothetical protein